MRFATRGATPTGAWYIVGVFAALLSMSYFDRYILALLANPVSQDLRLTDEQIGLLLGFGFAVVYSLAGLPIAWYLDRGNRVLAVVAGALVWSVATIGSSFTASFTQLLVLRAGVAIGEAVLTPAMVSLVADLFEPPYRVRPTAMYLTIGTVMSAGAFVAGGLTVDLAEWIQAELVDWQVWRLTLFLVGLPGILLALLLLATVREPLRRRVAAPTVNDSKPPTTATFLMHLRSHADFYIPFYLCVGFGVSLGFAGFSWVPTILVRAYGFDVAQSGYTFGMAAIPTIVIGMLFWSWLSGRIGPLLTMLLGVGVTLAAAFAGLLLASSAATVATAALVSGGSGCFTPVSALMVQAATPSHLHARLMAMVLLAASLIGVGVAPLAPPLIAGFWGDDPLALRQAVFTYALVVGVAVFVGLMVGMRGYQKLLREGAGDAQPGAPSTDRTVARPIPVVEPGD